MTKELTPEELASIKKVARIAECGLLLAEIALDSGLSPQICSALVIGYANTKLHEIKTGQTLVCVEC